jgi:hypothetical protein
VSQNDVAELADTGPEESAVIGRAIKTKGRERKSFCTSCFLRSAGRNIDPQY